MGMKYIMRLYNGFEEDIFNGYVFYTRRPHVRTSASETNAYVDSFVNLW